MDFKKRKWEPRDSRMVAPKDYDARRRMCYSKRRFRSERSAIRAAISSSRVYARPMREYRCPICGGWHLTSRASVDSQPMALAV